ncbi:iron-sulfur assembly protein 2 [Trichomonascus vanleenenianus]|uniref:Isa2p n=1 Tax=Trichomonascus vanleenenianus TaxID=2268995 RepID=UPI003ECAC396
MLSRLAARRIVGLPRLMVRTAVSTPTLGPNAPDPFTKITNPFKDEDGKLLKVAVSERAAEKLNEINKKDNAPNQILRVAVESGGCHGFQYLLSLKDASTIDTGVDTIFERDGARVVIDSTSLEILKDSTVDYTTELIGSQFKVVDSPYASSSCGCGSSFSFDPTKK